MFEPSWFVMSFLMILRTSAIDVFGFWIDGDSGQVSDYPALLARLRMEHSIREVALTFRTFGGQVRRALVSLELFEVEDAEYILGIFWRV